MRKLLTIIIFLGISAAFRVALILLASTNLYAHGGGLDAYGCHSQSHSNSYHCHNGDYLGVVFASQEAFLRQLNSERSTKRSDRSVYKRDDYLPYWADSDGDCINTRHEVLIVESRISVTMSENGCFVVSGEWLDNATNKIFTNPEDIDIDHTVALSEAHRSGASAWTNEEKNIFANDLLNSAVLEVMEDNTNASKGDKDPSKWLPPNTEYHFDYVKKWVEIKNIYGLTFDEKEKSAIKNILGSDIEF